MVRALVGIFVAALLAACGAPARPATVTNPRQATEDRALVVLDCVQQPQVRPTSYMIACSDGGNLVDQLRWSGWGPITAVAAGVGTVNDCLPDCAQGHEHGNPVAVTLADPAPWPGHPGTQRFTKLTVRYPGAHPANAQATEEYSLLAGDTPG
jgi:hypothetical protein